MTWFFILLFAVALATHHLALAIGCVIVALLGPLAGRRQR